jgi:hypothetical protein
MATGDQADVHARLKRLMPRWFGQDAGPTPVLDALLQAPANAFAWVHALIVYARAQARITTSTGGWLDLSARDFYGLTLRRRAGESDAAFSLRIRTSIFKPGATRQALIEAITDANLGVPPSRVFEVERPLDTGGYGGTHIGYGLAGGWGSIEARGNIFVDVPVQAAPPPYLPSGFGSSYGGFGGSGGAGAGQLAWSADGAFPPDQIFADIFAAIERVKPAGMNVWVHFY